MQEHLARHDGEFNGVFGVVTDDIRKYGGRHGVLRNRVALDKRGSLVVPANRSAVRAV